jgi:thioredoxin reductase (NADPH)
VAYRRLEAPGVEELTGAGIYYGSAQVEVDGCADQDVVVVGGANSAGQAAVFLSKTARRVIILVRADSLAKSMSHYLIAQLEGLPNVEVRTRTMVAGAEGDGHLERVRVGGPDGEEVLDATAMFVFIGAAPHTDWLGDRVARDERGFVLAGADVAGLDGRLRWPLRRDPYLLETSVPGVFVAGDVRHRSMKRVASAVGEGSMAVSFVHSYLADR